MKACEICGKEIPKERLEILPETDTCVQHSMEKKKVLPTFRVKGQIFKGYEEEPVKISKIEEQE